MASEHVSDEEQPTSTLRWLIETALLVALAFVLAQGIKSFVVQPFVIPSGSMLPTIQLGDRVIAEKLTYRFPTRPSPAKSWYLRTLRAIRRSSSNVSSLWEARRSISRTAEST